MQPILLKPLLHRGLEQIGIFFEKNTEINKEVRTIRGLKWSQTHKCWYVPLSEENMRSLPALLGRYGTVNAARLQSYQNKRKEVSTLAVDARPTGRPLICSPAWKLGKENLAALQRFIEQLKLKAYSPSTIKTYRNEFLQLLQLLKKKPVDELTTDDLRRYFIYCFEKLKLTENTLHSRINAIKFYFEQVLKREKFFWEIPRPKKPLQLPNVLGEKEITRLFKSLVNLKHKAILFTAYSAGLRVSETVNLKLEDIDSDRMQIKIKSAKGKKDRYVNLSPVLLDILRSYIKSSKPRPIKYLFESEVSGVAYSSRAAQKIFQRARQNAGIRKDVSFHSLRHSFATHLLEKGVDIRFIKDILGHFSIKTTERYLHLRKEQIIQITSPLDNLWLKGELP